MLLTRGDDGRGQEIIQTFQQRTGLTGERDGTKTVFELGTEEHSIRVVQTLTDIDPDWAAHVAVGDPAAEPDTD